MKSNIKWLITKSPYKQYEVAEKMEVTNQALNSWIRCGSYPSIPKAFKLAGILNCKIDDLYDLKEDENIMMNSVFDVVTKQGEYFEGVYFIQYNEKLLISVLTQEVGEVVKEIRAFNLNGEEQLINIDGLTIKRWYNPQTGEEYDLSSIYERQPIRDGKQRVYALARNVCYVGDATI